MKYITKNLDFQLDKRSVVTLGKFDGVHTGHSKLINRVMEIGKEGYETVVFTFDVSPSCKTGIQDQTDDPYERRAPGFFWNAVA